MENKKYLCLHDLPIFSGIDRTSFSPICKATNKGYKKKGEEVIIQIVGPGEIIGETALFIEGTIIKICLTQQKIASIVGSSRVMVSQVLRELAERKYIGRKSKYYILKEQCF